MRHIDTASTRPALSLFIIWWNARSETSRVIADLSQRFRVVGIFDLTWTKSMVRRNFERFYADLDVRGVYHLHNKGRGPFTAVIVEDDNACFEDRVTSRGIRRVNSRFLDAKMLYRAWTSEFAVHCSETEQEVRRDMVLLLGECAIDFFANSPRPFEVRRTTLHRDITGARGWTSMSQLFLVLNHAVNHVVLSHQWLTSISKTGDTNPIDLLTDDFRTLITILNARAPGYGRRIPPDRGGHFYIRCGAGKLSIGVHRVGGPFVDEVGASRWLERRVFDPARGIYVPSPEDAAAAKEYIEFSLSHHHRRLFDLRPPQTAQKQQTARPNFDLEGDERRPSDRDTFLGQRHHPSPTDPTLDSNEVSLQWWRRGRRYNTLSMRREVVSRLRSLAVTYYLCVRDWIVLKLPFLREVRQLKR